MEVPGNAALWRLFAVNRQSKTSSNWLSEAERLEHLAEIVGFTRETVSRGSGRHFATIA
jgi:hypothetical protein